MKRTYQPNNRKKAKKHGFFARKGTKIINNRRKKGRKKLTRQFLTHFFNTMKKRDVVKSNELFNEIIQKGKRISNNYFVICMMKKDIQMNNYGIAVGTKVGNAVTRNKIKRQMRNIIDHNIELFPNYHNYIIICKKDVLDISFKEMENELVTLLTNKGDKQ